MSARAYNWHLRAVCTARAYWQLPAARGMEPPPFREPPLDPRTRVWQCRPLGVDIHTHWSALLPSPPPRLVSAGAKCEVPAWDGARCFTSSPPFPWLPPLPAPPRLFLPLLPTKPESGAIMLFRFCRHCVWLQLCALYKWRVGHRGSARNGFAQSHSVVSKHWPSDPSGLFKSTRPGCPLSRGRGQAHLLQVGRQLPQLSVLSCSSSSYLVQSSSVAI